MYAVTIKSVRCEASCVEPIDQDIKVAYKLWNRALIFGPTIAYTRAAVFFFFFFFFFSRAEAGHSYYVGNKTYTGKKRVES